MRKIITIFSVLFLGAISAGAQNYDRGYETVPSSPFVTKGTWVAGGTLSYSQHVNDGHNILLISGVDSQGYNISVNPKLLYMIKGEIPTTILESILCCVPLYFICDLSIDETVGMVIGRISFAFLLIAVNLLLQRLFRESDKKRLVVLFYFMLVMIFSMPGIITAVAVMVFLPFYLGLALVSMAIVNTIVALILAFCCRKILERV